MSKYEIAVSALARIANARELPVGEGGCYWDNRTRYSIAKKALD